jgi:hypothetical protein
VPKIQIKDGVITPESYVKVTGQYTCSKGTVNNLTLDWPEGVIVNGAITLKNIQCPCCAEPIVIPTGKHFVNTDGVLVSE